MKSYLPLTLGISLLYSVASMAADTTVSAVAETRQHFNYQTNSPGASLFRN
jgi:hypothetical protein